MSLLQQADDFAREIANRKQLSNFESYYGEDGKEIKTPVPADAIYTEFLRLTGGAIKRLQSIPFVVSGDEIKLLEQPCDLFAYLAHTGIRVMWSDHTTGAISKREFHALVQIRAEKFELVSDLPSFPRMPHVFYTKDTEAKDTGKLEELVNKFNFATDVDRQLIKAMFMTPFWGGECGQRPAFLIDGVDNDEKGNRGIGKTTITDALVELCGGSCVDLTSKTEGDEIRKRLLTAYKERVVRMDNIKAQTLSNETLESLITAKRVSGHQMFHGHNSIPNAFTYVLTFNDAVLSKDMSQRCIIIRLKRPKYQADWWDKVVSFIAENREAIIADIGYLFGKESPELDAASRFPKWERAVLGKCAFDLASIQQQIRKDQENADDDSHLREDIAELMAEKIGQIQWKYDPVQEEVVYFDPAKHTVAINRSVVYKWLAELFHKGATTRHIAKRFQAAKPTQFLPESKKYLGAHYLVWVGHNDGESGEPFFFPRGGWRVEHNGQTRVYGWNFDDGERK